jgi:1-acyl-sn-glycerol-3-phosphate acyltransferase
MEKFSAWRDKGTGVAPFLPPSSARAWAWWPHAPVYVVVWPLRMLLLLVLSVWFTVMSVVAALLRLAVPLRGLSRLFERYYVALGARAALLFLGFVHVRSEAVSLRRSSVARRADAQRADAAAPQHGDVIVCNHASFVDVLYFAFRFGASFAFPARHWAADARPPASVVLASSPLRALQLTFGHFGAGRRGALAAAGELFSSPSAVSIGEASERAFQQRLGPIVLFAEGCASNGRAVLPFVPVLVRAALPARARVHVMALKYAKEGVAHEFVVRDSLAHVCWLAAQPLNSLTVLRLVADEQPSAAEATSSHDGAFCDAILGAPADSDAASSMALSTRLAGLLKVRRVAVSCLDKHAFDDKWLGRAEQHAADGKKER